MISSMADQWGLALGPALALLGFIFLFLGILGWIFRPGSRQFYERQAHLPLADSTGKPPGDAS